MTQIGLHSGLPIVHTVELLDWATGGPLPEALAGVTMPEPETEAAAAPPPADANAIW